MLRSMGSGVVGLEGSFTSLFWAFCFFHIGQIMAKTLLSLQPFKISCSLIRVWWGRKQRSQGDRQVRSTHEEACGPHETSRTGTGSRGGGTLVLLHLLPGSNTLSAGNICRPGGSGVPDAGFPSRGKIPEGPVLISFHPLGLCLNVTSSRKWSCGTHTLRIRWGCHVTHPACSPVLSALAWPELYRLPHRTVSSLRELDCPRA